MKNFRPDVLRPAARALARARARSLARSLAASLSSQVSPTNPDSLFELKDDYYPGDLGWDPLGLKVSTTTTTYTNTTNTTDFLGLRYYLY